jgi:hypothetical protein
MRATCLSAIAVLLVASAASADVTIKQTVSGKGLGMSGTSTSTTYIKGMRLRTEAVMGDTTRVTIFDVENQKMYGFETKKKEADVWDMQAFATEMNKSVDTSAMKASIRPNGQTKSVAGQTATGYTVEISMPSSLGGDGGMKMTVTLTGPMWIVKNAPGTKDFQNFYKAAVEKGWIFSDPRAAKGAPGQAKALAEMYRQMAETGGIPYESTTEIKMGGDGPMAGLMARMGNVSSTSTVQSVETGALADDLFAPPAGFKLNQRK